MMFDLFGLFVENVFGGLILAIVGIAFFIFVILALGRLSSQTIMSFLQIYFVAMAIGYGYALITVPIAVIIIAEFGITVYRYFSQQ